MKRSIRYMVRLAILLLVLGAIAPVQLRVMLQTPQTVEAVQPHVCVHTDLIHEVDEWKIQRTLQLVREMGADTIVEFFPWAYIEGAHGQFDWRQADRIVAHAQNQGVRIIARIGLVPQWARPEGTTMNYIHVTEFGALRDYAEAFVKRYAGVIDHIIIWNEPNLAFEWGFHDFQPETYTHMLRSLYDRLKRANPDLIVLAGALAPTLEPDGSPNGLNDLVYLERMYQAGAGDYFDALAVHTYGLSSEADAEPAPDALNFRRVELLRELMIAYGDGDKPIYITESGWNDSNRWVYGVRPAQRVAQTLSAFAWSAENWPYVEQHCLWIFRHPTDRGTYRDNFTLITPEFQPKPIYYAVQNYARGWQDDGALWLPPPGEAAR